MPSLLELPNRDTFQYGLELNNYLINTLPDLIKSSSRFTSQVNVFNKYFIKSFILFYFISFLN